MKPVLERVQALESDLEHITTADTARLVMRTGEDVAASVTPQHLLLNRNDLLVGVVAPHRSFLPVLDAKATAKRWWPPSPAKAHKFFLGTDSAPHAQSAEKHLRLRGHVQRRRHD